MNEKTPKPDQSGISVDQLAISADGELVGLSDDDLDAIAGGVMSDASTNINCPCGMINDQC